MDISTAGSVYSRSHQTKLNIASTLNMLCSVMDLSLIHI